MFGKLNRFRILRRFRDDKKGNVAVMFSVSAIAIIGMSGAAMDYATLSSAQARSQSISDQLALAAAVYVRDNGGAPAPSVGEDGNISDNPSSDSGFLDKSFKTYTAAELGYEFKGWVEGGAENVIIEVSYDDVNREVTTRVYGTTIPTFMQVLGPHDLKFSAESTAKYQELDFNDPASVLLILDNSGSMAFDDKPMVYDSKKDKWLDQDNAQPRIDALQSNATSFMSTLSSLVGNQDDDDDKVLRTGMMAYNTETISSRSVSMRWNTSDVTNSLKNMVANGGTNSAPPIGTARSWMSLEDKVHEKIHGKDPLEFVVFMTDGVNTSGGTTWTKEDGTGQWYGEKCTKYRRKGGCKRYAWDTVESETRPTEGRNWEEGKWEPTANIGSVADCTAMKNDGVRIYTIGFALQEGWYDTNGYFGDKSYNYIDADVRDQAYAFLASCASEADTFLTAENAEELEDAFSRIGADIQTEIIRLSN